MTKIQTQIDMLFNFIRKHSPVDETKVPQMLKDLELYEKYLDLLENRGLIRIKMPVFSNGRVFVFKSDDRTLKQNPWKN